MAWHCMYDGTENLPCNLSVYIWSRLNQEYVFNNTAPLKVSSFVETLSLYKDFFFYKQLVAWAAFRPRCVSPECLHVVPVVSVQRAVAVTEGGDRTIDGELWVCFDDDRTTISSSHLILVHSYSYRCTNPRMFGCSYTTVNNIYG